MTKSVTKSKEIIDASMIHCMNFVVADVRCLNNLTLVKWPTMNIVSWMMTLNPILVKNIWVFSSPLCCELYITRLNKNASLRKGNGRKLFDTFHHCYTQAVKKYLKNLITEILRSYLLLMPENGNKYPCSKKI